MYTGIHALHTTIMGIGSPLCSDVHATLSAHDAVYGVSMLYTILPYTTIQGVRGAYILVYTASILPYR